MNRKNGNLLLNIPVRGDGTIDEKEVQFLEGMAAWMSMNGDCVYGTRPWTIAAEGPRNIKGGGADKGANASFTGQDFRFTRKGDTIYGIAMAWPGEQAVIQSLAKGSPLVEGEVSAVHLLGCPDNLECSRTGEGLIIKLPANKPCEHAFALKIEGLKTIPGAMLSEKPAVTVPMAPTTDRFLKLPVKLP